MQSNFKHLDCLEIQIWIWQASTYAISRLHRYWRFKEKELLINSFINANFNYCPLIWHFTPLKCVRKIEQIHSRVLRILYNDFDSDFKTLFNKSG